MQGVLQDHGRNCAPIDRCDEVRHAAGRCEAGAEAAAGSDAHDARRALPLWMMATLWDDGHPGAAESSALLIHEYVLLGINRLAVCLGGNYGARTCRAEASGGDSRRFQAPSFPPPGRRATSNE